MNCSKSYFKKYDSDKSSTYDENEQTIDIILDRNKNNFQDKMTGNNFISFFDKVEELYLKLKFINTNKNINFMQTNNYSIGDDITMSKNNNIINNLNICNLNNIDEVIMELDRKIINDGMIKRSKNSFEYEF